MEVACVLSLDDELRAVGEARRVPREDVWEDELRRLEGIGAALESERPGEAFFALGGLRGLYGGRREGVLAAARSALTVPVRLGVAPTRFAAFAAARDEAGTVGPRRLREFLDPLPVSILIPRLGLGERDGDDLVETLKRLGVGTLGALAALAPAKVADRFGPPGLARAAPRPRRGAGPAHPPSSRGPRRRDRAARRDRRRAPRSRPRAADRPLPRGAAAQGPHRPRRAARGAAGRGRQLERRAGGSVARPPRHGSCAPCSSRGSRTCRRRRSRCGCARLARPAGGRTARALGPRPRAAPPPPRRGGARGARRPGGRGAAQGPRGRPRLAGARAPRRPHPVQTMSAERAF